MDNAVEKNAVGSLQTVPFGTPIEEVMAIMERDGGLVLEGVLSKEQVAAINADVDGVIDEWHLGTNKEDELWKAFLGQRTKRVTNIVTLSKTFRDEFLDNDTTYDYVRAMFKGVSDTMWLCTSQAIEIYPGEKAQPLHRDMYNYPVFVPFGPTGPEITCNMLIALCDVTEEIGATRVIPGSHKWDFSEPYSPEMTIPATMKAGSVVFISGKVVHGGGANLTQDQKRRVVSVVFNIGPLVPEDAHPFTVPMETVRQMSPRVQGMLGFRSFRQQDPQGGFLWQHNYEELADYLKL